MIFLSTYPLDANVMASVRLRYLLRFLANKNRTVICVCPAGETTAMDVQPGISVRALQRAGKWSYVRYAAREIVQEVQKNPREIVVASIPGIQSLAAAVLARWKSRIRFRLVLEVRDPFSLNSALPWSRLKRWVGYWMERVFLREPDQVIFLTNRIQSMYLNGFPGLQQWKTRHTVITNGYHRPTSASDTVNEPAKPLTFTYVGQFYDGRHPLDFLAALRDYLEKHPDTPRPRVQIAGQVHGEALQRQVKSICEDPSLQQCVHWLGTIPHDQTLRLMQSSDINLLITHDHGSEYAIPGKLFEYMGARRPVLAISRDPLVKQLTEETRLGWICEDRLAIAQWLKCYFTDADLLKKWRPDDRAIAAYHLENIHPRWLAFVEGNAL